MNDPKTTRPIGRWVLLKRVRSNADDSLILTPDNRIERNLKCEVLACGPGRWFPETGYVGMQFRPGDVVLVRQWRGILLNPQDTSVFLIQEEFVEALLPGAVA